MQRLIPAALHRSILPWAHRIRRIWRQWAKPRLRGVSVVLVNDTGQVLLLRHSYGKPHWALPGGGLSRSESPDQGAKREVREELGLDIGELAPLGELDETINGAPHHAYVFYAGILAQPQPDQREVIEARFFALDSLPEAISELTRARLSLLGQNSQQR